MARESKKQGLREGEGAQVGPINSILSYSLSLSERSEPHSGVFNQDFA